MKKVLLVPLLAVAAQGVFAAPTGSVFDDAQLWIKGWRDADGNGSVDRASNMPDARDAAASQMGECSFYGADTNRLMRVEDVPCPYSGVTLRSAPCLYLAQCMNVDMKGNWASLEIRAGRVECADGIHTIVLRLRPDQPINGNSYFYRLGDSFQARFYKVTDDAAHNGQLRLGGYNQKDGKYKTTDFYVDPGTWVDVAVVKDRSTVSFYAVTNGSAFYSYSVSATSPDTVSTTLDIGNYSNGNWGDGPYDSGTRSQSFRGSIQQVAVWNRALTEAEVREAFAFPRADVWRAGLEDGKSGEFVLETPGAAAADPGNWYAVPAALDKDAASSFAFDVRDHEAGLPQALRLTATAESDAGQISVSLNDEVLGTFETEPGKTASFYVAKDKLLAGRNVLTLTRQTPGRTTLDALALGGSFQVGYDDDSNAEFGAYGVSKNPAYAECASWQLSANALDPQASKDLKVTLPQQTTARNRWLFEVRAYTPYGMRWYDIPLEMQLRVNGQAVATEAFDASVPTQIGLQTFAVRLPPGLLRAGENTLTFANLIPSGTSRAWICVDWWRLSVLPEPKVGTVVLMR